MSLLDSEQTEQLRRAVLYKILSVSILTRNMISLRPLSLEVVHILRNKKIGNQDEVRNQTLSGRHVQISYLYSSAQTSPLSFLT